MILNWDDYFMSIAQVSALRSKDPSTQVGCCIVDKNKRIVSIGYNGMPHGHDDMPWQRGEGLDSKYLYVVHAELNAILNSKKDLSGCTIYVTLFPCNECSKAIVQAGITELVYLSDKYKDLDSTKASKYILDKCGVTCRQLTSDASFNIDLSVDK